jgi:hypothetical protein
MVAQVRYSVVRRSRGWVTLCAVYTVHVEMRSAGFLVETKNQGRRFVSGLRQNHWDSFLRFNLKTGGDGFSSLSSKPLTMISCLGLEIKQATIYRLRHKIDRRVTTRYMCRDLVTCFT